MWHLESYNSCDNQELKAFVTDSLMFLLLIFDFLFIAIMLVQIRCSYNLGTNVNSQY